MEDAIQRAFAYIRDGGAVMWPLTGAAALAWYTIGYRFVALRPGVVRRARAAATLAVAASADASAPAHELANARAALAIGPHADRLGRFRVALSALVIAAPLLGLLGTVTGMMETFGSLGDGALYASGGGIAAGISEALITTQMGLAVAIPGLLSGRALARREARIRDELTAVQHEVVARHVQLAGAELRA